MKDGWFYENMEAHRMANEKTIKEAFAAHCKPLPHLRRVEGHWLCTESRTERHILRGYWGATPMQAFSNFMFHSRILEAEDRFRLADTVYKNQVGGQAA